MATATVIDITDQFELERVQAKEGRKAKTAQRRRLKRQAAERAAELLGRGRTEDLDLSLLLQDLPANQDVKFVRFVLPCDREVVLPRMLLRRVGIEAKRNPRMKVGLRASIDATGLHFRWKTGGLSLSHSRPVSRWERRILVIPFSARATPEGSNVVQLPTAMNPTIKVAGGMR